jgi:hypothetical protein
LFIQLSFEVGPGKREDRERIEEKRREEKRREEKRREEKRREEKRREEDPRSFMLPPLPCRSFDHSSLTWATISFI